LLGINCAQTVLIYANIELEESLNLS